MLKPKARNLLWLKDQLSVFGRLLHEVGPVIACLWLVDRVFGRLLPFTIVVIALLDLIDCLTDHGVLPEGHRIEAADSAVLEALSKNIPEELNSAFISNALEKGDKCFIVSHGHQVAAFQWYSTTPTRMFEGAWIHPPPSRLYSYKDYVMPAFRGDRLHSLGKRSLAQVLARVHRKGLIWFCMATNAASLLSSAKIPGRRFGFALFRPSKAGLWVYSSPACRQAGIEFRSAP